MQALYSTFALSFETLTTRWLVGDLSPENMKGNMGAMLYAYVFLVIVVIIMFNLLIAIMGDSYDKIREHQVSGCGNDMFYCVKPTLRVSVFCIDRSTNTPTLATHLAGVCNTVFILYSPPSRVVTLQHSVAVVLPLPYVATCDT